MKSSLSLLLVFSFLLIFSQDFEWGKISQEEVDMKSVSFEPGADAVILKEYGNLVLSNNGYELEEHVKIKILSEEGFIFAQKRWNYNSNSKFDKVTVEKAHTINFVDGKKIETIIDDKDIIINKSEKGDRKSVV